MFVWSCMNWYWRFCFWKLIFLFERIWVPIPLRGVSKFTIYLRSHQCIRGSIVSATRLIPRALNIRPCFCWIMGLCMKYLQNYQFILFLIPVEQTPRIVILIAVIYPQCFILKCPRSAHILFYDILYYHFTDKGIKFLPQTLIL